MTFDKAILQSLVIRVDVTDYVRIVPREHAATPLGMGFGKTRFASPKNKFKLIREMIRLWFNKSEDLPELFELGAD